uniref:Uncharacterized protein n=1 Tax=Sinocyclocheilus rhinocerous TaxID=307959 RepID=A0A673FM47_9TELE
MMRWRLVRAMEVVLLKLASYTQPGGLWDWTSVMQAGWLTVNQGCAVLLVKYTIHFKCINTFVKTTVNSTSCSTLLIFKS